MTEPLPPPETDRDPATEAAADKPSGDAKKPAAPNVETGGPKGPEPTRYGDWERKGRCIDF